MLQKQNQKKIKFYIDTSVVEVSVLKCIVEDYFFWFTSEDKTELVLFASSKHPQNIGTILNNRKNNNSPDYTFIKEIIKPRELHKYYTKKFLLNEWVNYKKNDIFRLYKFFFPLNSDVNFDNQAISIQYDIRYHRNRNDEYGSYKKDQLSAVESAIKFYKPRTVLDIGCGAGAQYFYLKKILTENKTKYIGIDMSRFQLMKAIDLFESDLSAFTLGNAMKLNFQNQFSDIAFSESTLPFLSDPVKGLSELNRTSKHGFFASLYTIKKRQPFLNQFKKNNIYAINTGATWKYLNKITPNIYYLPAYSNTVNMVKSFENVVIIEENSDQFFEPLGIKTTNLFFFPKDWYKKTKDIQFNFRPLM